MRLIHECILESKTGLKAYVRLYHRWSNRYDIEYIFGPVFDGRKLKKERGSYREVKALYINTCNYLEDRFCLKRIFEY